MIRRRGVVFEKDKPEKKALRDLTGDSDVGQASEFPSRSLGPPSLELPPSQMLRRTSRRASAKRQAPRFIATSKLLSRLGMLLIIFSIGGFLFTYGPIIQVEVGYRLSRLFEKDTVERGYFSDLLDKTLLGEIEGVPDPNFSLIIPKIHAKGKIIANVDPADEKAYMEALKAGIAHAKGTDLPGGQGTIYLFAHSTDSPINIVRYNAVFYLLRELEPGDDIEIYFGGVKHRYKVFDKKIVEPTDVSYLSAANPEGKELVILQTCWPPGTTLKRLLVFAEKTGG